MFDELIFRLQHAGTFTTDAAAIDDLLFEAADVIQYLLEGADEVNQALRKQIEVNERLKEQLDAAVADLNQYGQCGACKHYPECGANEHSYCDGGFKWRGVAKEDAQ